MLSAMPEVAKIGLYEGMPSGMPQNDAKSMRL